MADSTRTRRRPVLSAPPESPAHHIVNKTVYGQLERIFQGPIPLPSRIRSMIEDPELALAPDERASGAILVNWPIWHRTTAPRKNSSSSCPAPAQLGTASASQSTR